MFLQQGNINPRSTFNLDDHSLSAFTISYFTHMLPASITGHNMRHATVTRDPLKQGALTHN